LSRVFRSEDKKITSVWIPSLELESDEDFQGARSTVALEEPSLQISDMIERAREEALSIVEDAEVKSKLLCERAKQEGFKQGYNAGFQEGLNQAEELIMQAREALAQSQRTFEEYLQKCEPYLLALVIEIAEKVIGTSIDYDPELIFPMIRKGIEALGEESNITIRVNPEFAALLEGGKQGLEGQFNSKTIEIVADPSISTGAIVESPHGQADVTLDTQLRKIAEAIGEARMRLSGPDEI